MCDIKKVLKSAGMNNYVLMSTHQMHCTLDASILYLYIEVMVYEKCMVLTKSFLSFHVNYYRSAAYLLQEGKTSDFGCGVARICQSQA